MEDRPLSKEIPIIHDDIVLAPKYGIDIIAQQTNCLTIRGKGLSKHISDKLGVNPYVNRRSQGRNLAIKEDRGVPGSIQLMLGHTHPYVVNIYGQWRPGKPNLSDDDVYINELGFVQYDTKEMRLCWFQECLSRLHVYLVREKIDKIGIPYGIGCGLAGGDWSQYYHTIKEELPEAVLFKFS